MKLTVEDTFIPGNIREQSKELFLSGFGSTQIIDEIIVKLWQGRSALTKLFQLVIPRLCANIRLFVVIGDDG